MFPNGKSYIGVTGELDARWRAHCQGATRGKGFAVGNAITLFGKDSVNRSVLVIGPQEFIWRMEALAITSFETKAPGGYNIADGGNGSPSKSEQARALIGQSALRRWQCPDYRRKMSERATGVVMTPEQNARNAEAKRGNWLDPDYRKRTTASHTGKRQSMETVQRRVVALKEGYATTDKAQRMRVTMTGRKFITDGLIERVVHCVLPIPFGWVLGRSPLGGLQNKGKMTITNGVSNKFIHVCSDIPAGWWRGNVTKGRVWITDGTKLRRIVKDSPIPEGWLIKAKTKRKPKEEQAL